MFSFRRVAIWTSVAFHVALLAALATWYVGHRQAQQRAQAEAAADRAAREAQPKPQLPSPEVTRAQVAATLAQATKNFAEAPTDEQLSVLDKHAAKLQAVSSPAAVAEIADKFHEWETLPARASAPAAQPIAGDFDFDSAQIHDVLRTAAEDGAWNYRSVLVDAQGRTFEVDLDRDTGEKTYATFASLKKFPLAEQVYRQIVMGMIDQALRKRETQPADDASEAVVAPATVERDDRDPFDDRDEPK